MRGGCRFSVKTSCRLFFLICSPFCFCVKLLFHLDKLSKYLREDGAWNWHPIMFLFIGFFLSLISFSYAWESFLLGALKEKWVEPGLTLKASRVTVFFVCSQSPGPPRGDRVRGECYLQPINTILPGRSVRWGLKPCRYSSTWQPAQEQDGCKPPKQYGLQQSTGRFLNQSGGTVVQR